MKILVLDYARDFGGGNTISNNIIEQIENDMNNEWLILTSKYSVDNKKNLYNLQIKNIKKSLFHRIFFEMIEIKKILKIYQPDLVFSLQNLSCKKFKGIQVVYLHQALPFSNQNNIYIKNLRKKYKYFLNSKLIKNDLKKDHYVVIQTEYMKSLISNYKKDKIIVNIPKVFKSSPKTHSPTNNFIYPTNSEKYKRNDLAFKLAKYIKKKNMDSIIKITLNGDENEDIKKIYEESLALNLPLEFIGKKSIYELELLYKNNNLLFCSEIESLGLPLIEAMHYGCRIFTLNTPFANEILKNYNNKEFFLENDLFEKFQEFIKNNGVSEGLNINDEPLLTVLKNNKIIN